MFIRGSKQLGNSNAIRTGQSQDSCATACAPTQYQRKRLCVFRLCALLYLTRFAAACPARSLGQLGPRKTSKRADGFGSRRVGAGGIFQSLPSRRPYLVSWQLPLLWLHGSARNLPIYCAAETCNDLIRLCESGSRRLVPEGACGGAWTKKPHCHKTCKRIILHVRSLCIAPSYSHLLAQPDLCFYFCLLSHQKIYMYPATSGS